MSDPDPRSLLELLAGLARDIPDLFQKEVRLARGEAARALELLLSALGRLALGSVIAIGAVGVALAALVNAVSAVLITRGVDPPLASVIAASTVTLIAALIAWLFFMSAVRSLKAARASLDGSVRTLTESAADIVEKF
jgi:hypothetical protein